MLLSLLSICINAFVMTLEEESCDCCFGYLQLVAALTDLKTECIAHIHMMHAASPHVCERCHNPWQAFIVTCHASPHLAIAIWVQKAYTH